MHRENRSARGRFIWGIALLILGAYFLAINIGVAIPHELWEYWPALPLVFGLLQLAWPGSLRERLGGIFLASIGVYGFVSTFEMFGLNWGTAWPIMLVAIGLRIVIGGMLGEHRRESRRDGDQGGAP